MGRNNSSSGFTLVETLIAMVLLSLLMISGALAYDYFSQNWQRNKGLAESSGERHHLASLVQKVTWNTYSKAVYGENDRLGFYFLGRAEGFTAVSHTSVQNPDAAAVYRLFREANGDGTFRLVYEEAVLTDVYLSREEQELPFNFRRILYDNIGRIDFRYYGYQSLRERNDTVSAEAAQAYSLEWFNDYDGMQRVLHPQAIEVDLNGFRWLIEVPDAVESALSRYTRDV
ncbi:prepilin-type N-terminal cleavage/methylation domain-containing protein [Pseudidiomarina sp. 1ASP75-14]|uniref:PulJ/GspJ family protein n=1 Tax=Pseudidiomarina terrestris TaxID=2820060 RepID=UPI0026544EB8|nr:MULTISPECIES: prepilin-type N-terminal cleavage/methylation domain-containing protein [unclassified Pseudidiomarina]MDN7126980.1 prepilin-type N-terminal cleavage/methylation domain-containing protein [Pseudidiomarina sp. 1APR75-33.1]MDN7136821.1 prepilin-type N-terminal cleavage/methylation domain-containing protein [Pseudidiomarina sp. 1ASP75-14]